PEHDGERVRDVVQRLRGPPCLGRLFRRRLLLVAHRGENTLARPLATLLKEESVRVRRALSSFVASWSAPSSASWSAPSSASWSAPLGATLACVLASASLPAAT